MNSRNILQSGIVVLLASVFLLDGCGTSSTTGGGQSVPQPIKQPSTNGNGTPAGGKGNSSGQGTNNQNSGGTNTKNIQGSGTNSGGSRVTIPLSQNPIGPTGAGDTFIAGNSSIQAVLVPTGWNQSSSSLGNGGSRVWMTSPRDSSQMVSEVIQSSARDLQGFYNGLGAGQGRWIVPNQIVRYSIANPSNPYIDEGIMANLSTGGSIRVDVYLPSADAQSADIILNSFISTGTSHTQGTTS